MKEETENKYVAPQEYYEILIQKFKEAIAAYCLEVLEGTEFNYNNSTLDRKCKTMGNLARDIYSFRETEFFRSQMIENMKTPKNPV